jgi:hypothetical protein
MKQESRTGGQPRQVDSPLSHRHLPLVDLLVDTRTELFELAVRSGLKVLEAMMEEDRTALCGPRYVHGATREAARAGTVPSEVVLWGAARCRYSAPASGLRDARSPCQRFARSPGRTR